MNISVVIPCYNSESYISDTLISTLNQTIDKIEIVLVDDGSSDSTVKLAKKFLRSSDVIIESGHLGVAAARNVGVLHSTGDLISFLDSDDLAYVDKIERGANFLNHHPDYAGCGHFMNYMSKNSRICGVSGMDKYTLEMVRFGHLMPFPFSSFMCRRVDVLSIGGFNEHLPGAEDLDLISRLANRGNIYTIPEILGAYRVHGNSISDKQVFNQELGLKVVRYLREIGEDNPSKEIVIAAKNELQLGFYERSQALSRSYFRRSGSRYINRRYLSALYFLMKSFIFSPSYTLRRFLLRLNGKFKFK